jgi:DUF1680 family protein
MCIDLTLTRREWMTMAAAAAATTLTPAWGAKSGAVQTFSDHFTPVAPGAVKLQGLLGKHVDSLSDRLDTGQSAAYLEPFTNPSDTKGWRAEHIGKWLEAAGNYARYKRDDTLRGETDRVVATLLKVQQPDGWLGSYVPELRFHNYDWAANVDRKYTPYWMGPFYDVWCHALTILGLLNHYEASRDGRVLDAARKMADLLAATFGPGKQDIMLINHDHGFGPAASILPMARLYLLTGDRRYLDFCRYVIGEFGRAGKVPIKVARTVTAQYPFTPAAHIKHCEFELCLMGMGTLYRATGEGDLLATMLNIYNGYFAPLNGISPMHGFRVPVDGREIPDTLYGFLETCDIVPMTRWFVEMAQISGDSRYLDAMEWQVYNALLSRDLPDGKVWPGVGAPTGHLFHCCSSMLSVGLSLLPSWTYFRTPTGILVNFYESSELTTVLGGTNVRIVQTTEYPLDGRVNITVNPEHAARFDLLLRIPQWSRNAQVLVNGKPERQARIEPGQMARISRRWQSGDTVSLALDVSAKAVKHVLTRTGREEVLTVERGPLILAAIAERNRGVELASLRVSAGASDVVPMEPTEELKAVRSDIVGFRAPMLSVHSGASEKVEAVLVPYAYAKVSDKPIPAPNELVISVYGEDGVGPNVRVEFPAASEGA